LAAGTARKRALCEARRDRGELDWPLTAAFVPEGGLKVFVGFGYNDRDRWIPELVFPLVRAFNCEVVTGEDMQGEEISNEVQRRVENSDALIAFRTRREGPDQAGVYRTHRWVEDELVLAIGQRLRVVEVREEGVDEQRGLPGGRQWIQYKQGERDRLLVELAKTIGEWVRAVDVSLQLLPPAFVEQIRPLLRAPGFRCTYTLLEGGRESAPKEVQVRPIKGGLFIQAAGVSPESLIQVSVEGDGRRWTSDYESLDSVGINLKTV